jgi:iron(III) transport system substrate-binding protein
LFLDAFWPKETMITLKLFVAGLLIFSAALPAFAQSDPRIDKAKEEKTVFIYGSTQLDQINAVIKRFTQRYPFVGVNYNRLASERLLARVITEARAGAQLPDIVISTGGNLVAITEKGLLAAYQSPERKAVNDIHKDKQGFWTGLYANLEFWAYNKKLVAPADVPKARDDLLAPKWKGKIGLDSGSAGTVRYVIDLHVLGQEKGRSFMQRLAKQDVQLRRGPSLIAELLAAGEFSLAPVRDNTTFELMQAGAPIDWVAFDPVIPQPPTPIGIVKGARHVNAAQLFVDFVLSREGQETLRSVGRYSTRIDVEPISDRVRKLKLGKIDWQVYLKDFPKYMEEYRKYFN